LPVTTVNIIGTIGIISLETTIPEQSREQAPVRRQHKTRREAGLLLQLWNFSSPGLQQSSPQVQSWIFNTYRMQGWSSQEGGGGRPPGWSLGENLRETSGRQAREQA